MTQRKNLAQICPVINGVTTPRTIDMCDELADLMFMNPDVFFTLSSHSREALEAFIATRLEANRTERFPSVEFNVPDVSKEGDVFSRISLYVRIQELWRDVRIITDDNGNTFTCGKTTFQVNWSACGAQDTPQAKEFARVLTLVTELCEELTKKFSYDTFNCVSTVEIDQAKKLEMERSQKLEQLHRFALAHTKFMRRGSRKIEPMVHENLFKPDDRGIHTEFEVNNHTYSARVRSVYDSTIDVLITRLH